MARRPPAVCGRLAQKESMGPVDVCKLPAGHPPPHEGAHFGTVWEDRENRKDAKILRRDRPIGTYDVTEN